MAIVRKIIYEGMKPTPKQIREVEEAYKHPVVYDEDCPELTDKQLDEIAALVRARDSKLARETVNLTVSPVTARLAKEYGEGVMGRLLDLAVQDEAMLRKCL
ncbi:MAG: hypothetical protein IJ849_07090 [Selenomonadaceae bacterium]|nr:hypothetical protein [Selenomonadaceae bacterium]